MNDYLFNATGETDTEITEMENLLGELSFKPRPLDLDALGKVAPINSSSRFNFAAKRFTPALLAAAAVVFTFAVTGVWFSWFMFRQQVVVESIPANPPAIPSQANKTITSQPASAANENSSAVIPVKSPLATYQGRTIAKRKLVYESRPRMLKRTLATPPPSAETVAALPANQSRDSQAAAEDLLLALAITNQALSNTQKEIRSRIPTINLPAFMTEKPALN